jgi:hypothetical protein
MTSEQLITIALSSGVVAALVSTSLNYVFDSLKDKSKRLLEIKQSAYVKAISSISGITHSIANLMVQKDSSKQSAVTTLSYLSNFKKEIAPAILVASKEVRKLLDEFADSITKGTGIFDRLIKDARQVEGGFIAGTNQSLVAELRTWNTQTEELEQKVIYAMQKDLGLPSD